MAAQFKDLIDDIPSVYSRHLNGIFASTFIVRQALKYGKYDLVCYFGHGKPDRWKDAFGYVIGERHATLFAKSTIVFSFACESLESLGPAAVNAGAAAFIGNARPVYHVGTTRPVNVARAFRSVWFNEVVNLLRGIPVAETVAFAKAQWADLANQLGGDDAACARYNGQWHGYVGDGTARLPPVVAPDGSNLDWNAIPEVG